MVWLLRGWRVLIVQETDKIFAPWKEDIMDIRSVASGSNVAGELSAVRRSDVGGRGVRDSGQEVPERTTAVSDSVELSVSAAVTVEKSGDVAQGRSETETSKPETTSGDAVQSSIAGADLRRSYNVEEGEVVVRFVDKKDDEVVKEIPAKELRRIKEAIAKFVDSELNQKPQTPDQELAHTVDIAS